MLNGQSGLKRPLDTLDPLQLYLVQPHTPAGRSKFARFNYTLILNLCNLLNLINR
jgi:hypothetical protein